MIRRRLPDPVRMIERRTPKREFVGRTPKAPQAGLLTNLKSHPMREALTLEMHARRLPRLRVPAQVLQIVALLHPAQTGDAERHLAAIPGCEPPATGARYQRCKMGKVDLVWERH